MCPDSGGAAPANYIYIWCMHRHPLTISIIASVSEVLQKQLINFLGYVNNAKEPMAFDNICGVKENALVMANSSTESQMEMELSTQGTENSDLFALTSSGKEIEQGSLAGDATFSRPVKK